jgi:hypothetical protein
LSDLTTDYATSPNGRAKKQQAKEVKRQEQAALEDALNNFGQNPSPAPVKTPSVPTNANGNGKAPATSESERAAREAAAVAATQPVASSNVADAQDGTVSTMVNLSNGTNQVACVLKTQTQADDKGAPLYQMFLVYKNVSFSSSLYRIKDQAFYELQSKLMERGLTIMTCGSCGYFHNPVAEAAQRVKNPGLCLYGKVGKEINFKTDTVTVVSQACPYHTSIDHRGDIVQEWQSSLV